MRISSTSVLTVALQIYWLTAFWKRQIFSLNVKKKRDRLPKTQPPIREQTTSTQANVFLHQICFLDALVPACQREHYSIVAAFSPRYTQPQALFDDGWRGSFISYFPSTPAHVWKGNNGVVVLVMTGPKACIRDTSDDLGFTIITQLRSATTHRQQADNCRVWFCMI